MLTALILVCSAVITPDLSNCNDRNAIHVLRVPTRFANTATCFMNGQAYLAQTTIGRDLAVNDRVKVVCTFGQRAGAPITQSLQAPSE